MSEQDELERAYQVLSTYGVPKERAKNVPNGIMVLMTRMDKERDALRAVNESSAAQASSEGVRVGAESNSEPASAAGPNANVTCHAPGDKCLGCDHYYGKAAECKYKSASGPNAELVKELPLLLLYTGNDPNYVQRRLEQAADTIARCAVSEEALEIAREFVRHSEYGAVQIMARELLRLAGKDTE